MGTSKRKSANNAAHHEKKTVELSSLAVGDLFSHEGKTWSRRRPAPDGIRALSAKGDVLITLASDTLVTPK